MNLEDREMLRRGFFISVRLSEERNRLRLTQDEVARCCSVSASTVRAWEKERAIPCDKLALLISIGFDVQYIISGCYSVNMDQVGLGHGECKPLSHAAKQGSESSYEQELLMGYRELSDDEQRNVRVFINALTKKGADDCQ